ncbi:hypothetical protein [Brevibacillus sp. NRS-1366]|uniref:hypothetical protein n=1 Tax=Brevibacillus sp. NRS-1366 TaxID=3233899 RepID=UPI003D1DE965
MLYFIGLVAILFFLSFFNTIKRIHDQDRYIIQAAITAFLGAYLIILIIEEIS